MNKKELIILIKEVMLETEQDYDKKLKDFISFLQKKFEVYYKKTMPNSLYKNKIYDIPIVKHGKRWDKIVMASKKDSTIRSVYCFVDTKTGLIYKPAGYNSPAKGARASIFDFNSYKNADTFGSWLYRR